MKVKVCGLRDPDNLADVHGLGVDYLGLIFHPGSPRFAGQPELAEFLTGDDNELTAAERVGVFVNAEVDYLLNTVHDYRLDWVQLHGEESAGYCRELKLLWSVDTLRKAGIWKAFRIDEQFDFRETQDYVDSCSLFVFDTGGGRTAGGTGRQWDWSRLAEYTGPTPFLLSGGIGPEDAARLRRIVHPQFRGIDLNSRFEVAPGDKDIPRLRDFLAELRA